MRVKTPDDVERDVEGCLNDFETGISDKEETIVSLAELVVHIYKSGKKEQLTKSGFMGRSELRQAVANYMYSG